ncbi:hypothetical protein GT037_005742 [Alternaria burnsii]|uniref:Ribosomal protein/NADH dehydrogenase domain-containing protein n=5 Tax=Alternaria sect. Alternaria TaxID=2499237 RepID=A0A8H7EF33_9PLEO|nr:uncharacterized protein GT037_005742 [Alternaria burnsii]KAF7676237.1 hypothetical protein GT037_005742 [Alternaria burnsii]
MRFSSGILLALPVLAVAEEQVPLLDKVKGFFNKATAAVSASIPSMPSAPVDTATSKAASNAAAAIQYPITLENWKEVLTVDPTASPPTTQDWLIFTTGGNTTCFGLCGNATKAWNASLPIMAAKTNAPKFAYLDCEAEPILCNAWSVGAPALYYFQVPKPMADQSAPVPTVRYQPLNRTSTTTETFKKLIVDNDIEQVTPYEGPFHPFNGALQQYNLAIPYGYVTWGFSKMPSWMPMIIISFLSRSFMSKQGTCNRPPTGTSESFAGEDDRTRSVPKKFWRNMLPRMKYRNPSIPIEIARHNDPDGPSLLHVYTSKTQPATGSTNSPTAQQSDSSPPSGTPNPRNTLVPDTSKPTYTIDIRDQSESEILEALVQKTGAQQLEPTEQELAEMKEIEEFKERSEADRVQVRERLLKERREAELLKLARGEVPATN